VMSRNNALRRAVVAPLWPPTGHRTHIKPSGRKLLGNSKRSDNWNNSRNPAEYQSTALKRTSSSALQTTITNFSAMPISSQPLHRDLHGKYTLTHLCAGKHFFNDPTALVLSALKNVKYANPALSLDDANKIIYHPAPSNGKTVALVSGGGAGHEPSFTRYARSSSVLVFNG
jgi:hypothetical protein